MNLNNRRIIIREVADDILGMKLAAAKIVPKLLNFDQKQCRLNIAQEMLRMFTDDPDLL